MSRRRAPRSGRGADPGRRRGSPRPSRGEPGRRRSSGATAYLLVGHGSRVGGANALLRRVALALRRRLGRAEVAACFLEAAAPGPEAGIDRLVERGARRILLVPYFLYFGGHVGRDLPRLVERAGRRHPGVSIRLARPLGFDRRLVAIVADRVRGGRRAAGWGR